MNVKPSVKKPQREYRGNYYTRIKNKMILTCTLSLSRDQEMQPKRQDKDSLPSHINGLTYVAALVWRDFRAVKTNWCSLSEEGTPASLNVMIPFFPWKTRGLKIRLGSILHFRNLMWCGNYMRHNCLQSCQHMQGWTVGLDFLFFLVWFF